jgi:hypothetical protein
VIVLASPVLSGVFKRGEAPLLKIISPSPFKERGIKGVRLIDNIC